MTAYQTKLRALLSHSERRAIQKLSSPKKIQDFLDSFPVLKLGRGEHSMKSPREVLKIKKAHCMEGAMLAAASLAYQGLPPLLMDLQATDDDEDHVVAIFKEKGLYGAISKTNHPVLRWRDPVYKTPRELAMSYFNEYFIWWSDRKKGAKTLRAYSKPFNLKKYKPEEWVTAKGNLDWLAEELDSSPHFPVAPASVLKNLRRADFIEMRAAKLEEWN